MALVRATRKSFWWKVFIGCRIQAARCPTDAVAVDLALGPVGSTEPWAEVQYHAVDATDGKPARRAATRTIAGADVAKGAGLLLQVALPGTVRERVTAGD
ncbi:MAG: hypothetical protein EXR79_11025 [Myxococcales bacterium]|nr:hypothetical protein [Myxococcales bacterium]